ncbi:pilus (Caulobacter type) biogenesis lipoprotein CpaD [Methylorubrum populi BJ001]|jgi:pilus assembly protein CpaD|uniref:Pilus (Caulobacter type) biogenesis lipoprotein CpaD n=1 Tax=Methylorubrum populi (strain ATCC BAA-705 / NCIMB 13946 / BJ001) TaxID=441620 RepID=B1ZA61_METPB|nr:CpaD family pilus assembly protein [Methylorubrum populi]ACB80571.1 pilus (Caulobacter type) biogenesis lipoprotein CpaD [Methylorubrum populi BJ001]OAH33332.1 pilus assembly protein CpaD [Methylorubrum populi]PZP66542.1 MAG: pilus assembly protein CpaD [Methylorubrum populi]
MSSPARTLLRRARPVAALLLAAGLGACRADRVETTGSTYPIDVRTRHPIVLADADRSLDVFPTGIGHIDPRQRADIEAFLVEYRRYGRGILVVELPRGVSPGLAGSVERTGAEIRRLAAEMGVPAAGIRVANYPVANPTLASPLRLSFQRMQAKVADKCGLWPRDLGVSDLRANWSNEPTWNLGCATQANLAAQVADPIDLVRGRPEGRIDTVLRTKDLGQLREGKDPSTQWRQDGQTNVGNDVKSQ